MLIFSAFCITFTTLVNSAMVLVGVGIALFVFTLAIFAVLGGMVTEIVAGVRANS